MIIMNSFLLKLSRIGECMDYKKLNKATRKDNFSLPFIDQILDR